jgi:hypothetical protein
MAKAAPSRQLIVPPEVHDDPEAAEVVRAWIAHGDLHCTLKPTIWDDPGNWGILLADLARHVARAFQQHAGKPPDESLARIRAAFAAEMDEPTSAPEGGFDEEH